MQSERDFLLDIENDLQCAISLVGHECDLEIVMFTIRKARVKVNERLVDLWAGSTERAQIPILQTEIQTTTDVLLDALNSIATETCDHGPGMCPREIAVQALADYNRIVATLPKDGPERIRVIVRPGKDDWIGVAYSSSIAPNDVIREYVKLQ